MESEYSEFTTSSDITSDITQRLTVFEYVSPGTYLCACANGYRGAFSAGGEMDVIALILNSLVESVKTGDGEMSSRLSKASNSIERLLASKFGDGPESLEDSVRAEFMAVGIEGTQCYFSWVGSFMAQLVRSGAIVHSTNPHVTILPQRSLRSYGEIVITDKHLSSDTSTSCSSVEFEGPWTLKADDVLCIADCRMLLKATDNDYRTLLESEQPFSNSARRLVQELREQKNALGQCAMLVRMS